MHDRLSQGSIFKIYERKTVLKGYGKPIKVAFNLTMSILAYNLYRLLVVKTQKYVSVTAETLFVKMVTNSGRVEIAFAA